MSVKKLPIMKMVLIVVAIQFIIICNQSQMVSADYFKETLENKENVFVDGDKDEFYEQIYDDDSIVIYFANSDLRFALLIESKENITFFAVDQFVVGSRNYQDENIIAYFTNDTIECVIVREVHPEATFRIIVNDHSVECEGIAKNAQGAPEVVFGANAEDNTWKIILLAIPVGFAIASMIIALWRISYYPTWVITESATSVRGLNIGRFVSCEPSRKIPGLWTYLFQKGNKINVYYAKCNAATIMDRLLFYKHLQFWAFISQITPVMFQVPVEKRWNKTRVLHSKYNLFIRILQVLLYIVPSTRLKRSLDEKLEREELKEQVTEVKYFLILLEEDRYTTVCDVSYEKWVLKEDSSGYEWKLFTQKAMNYQEIADLKNRTYDSTSGEPKLNSIRDLKIANDRKAVEKYHSTDEALKDRASLIENKVKYEQSLVSLEDKIKQLSEHSHMVGEQLRSLQMEFNMQLENALKTAFKQIDHNRQYLPQIVDNVIGMIDGGISKENARQRGLETAMDSKLLEQKTYYENLVKSCQAQMARMQSVNQKLIEKLGQKSVFEINVPELMLGAEESDAKSSEIPAK